MNIFRKFKIIFSGFRAKLILAFLVATLLPLGIIAGISYRVSYKIAEDRIMSSALMSDQQGTAQVNDRIGQTENVADAIIYQMYSLGHASDDIAMALETFRSARNFISLYKSTFDFYHIFVFLQPEHIGAGEGLYFFSIDQLSRFNFRKDWLRDLGGSSKWLFQPEILLPYTFSHGESSQNNILCFRALDNQSTEELEYAYCIVLRSDELSQMLRTFDTDAISSYILSEDGQIVAHSDPSLTGSFPDEDLLERLRSVRDSSVRYNGTHYTCTTLDNGWIHVTEIPNSYIRANTHVLIQTILLALVFFIPLTILIILLLSRSLSRRLQILSHAMESFRLERDTEHPNIVLIPHPSDPDLYDEVDRLGLTFEEMERTIVANLKSIVDLSLKEERLKYQLLQSQINPHFLYNILSSIQTCQMLGKLDVSNQMISNLTAFYRLTLRKSGELITIQDELEISRLYLNIEKLCHKDNLNWEINTESGVENFMICKFTLQPFLENSILHGLADGVDSLHIAISVSYGDDTVIISISDDGAGIPPKTLEQLRLALEQKTVNYEQHFGISNVNARISSPLYGNGSVKIESEIGRGTRVTIEFLQMEG